MIQIKQIYKEYRTGNLVQKALDGVSLNLRENEFVAILGPSGSGKTTLLNIIGGLDRYDSGDLIINGISTKRYKDRDWDSYRNHTIGFVFQSYNLIPHQTVLSNVELALTISGISGLERKKRAADALEKVGLGEQLHKKPNQMSGGQMQRVAIARALVNDPDILLADEPTGALDSETSVQVMELLKEVAKDRLVVMVTHNPELAEDYATRIVNLKDGAIRSDSDPFVIGEEETAAPVHKNMGKASMSFLTALSLSFHNLQTKKARTLLTSFAGSIGVIGIALILSISNGVNAYIQSMEESTMSEYPLTIQSSGMDIAAMMLGAGGGKGEESSDEVRVSQMITNMLSEVDPNDLESLKRYFDDGESGIEQYVNAIEYSYDVAPQIYRLEEDAVRQVNPDRSFSALGIGTAADTGSFMSAMMNTDVFHEMPENSSLFQGQYDVKAGRWPEKYNECVVVLTANGSISDLMLYTLGLRDVLELDEMIRQFITEEKVETPDNISGLAYEELLGITFKLVNGADCYEYDDAYQVWKDKTDDDAYMRKLVENGEDITIVGVVKPSEDASAAMLSSGIGYPASLTRYAIEQAKNSPIVRQQMADPTTNVLTGNSFGEDNSQNKFDMESLFSINEEGLRDAFGFDEGALDLDMSDYFNMDKGSFDLSNMIDPDKLALELPELSGVNMEDIVGQLDLSVSPDSVQQVVSSLLDGYGDYAVKHPEADYSRLNEYFTAYLQTPETQQKIRDSIADIMQANGGIKLTPEQMGKIIQDIIAGYQEYAASNTLPDPGKMEEHFSTYLQTSEAKQILTAGISGLIDMEALKSQLSGALGSYMKTAMGSYTGAVSQAIQGQISAVMQQIMEQMGQNMKTAMSQLGGSLENAFHIDPEAFMNAIEMNMDEEELAELLRSLMSAGDASYVNNLKKFGYEDLKNPSQIDIYPLDFESKAAVLDILDAYNSRMEKEGNDEKVINYTDLVGTLMSSVTEIVDMISYVLIAFVAISLVVSSIMIGVITYISVLERKKEIGILRAIGASKGNVSQVFNAETFIIGLCAGLIGIGLTLLLLIPGNALIHSLAGSSDIHASLPVVYGIVLIVLSVFLTLLGGLIPSRKAAKSDPVAALRSE